MTQAVADTPKKLVAGKDSEQFLNCFFVLYKTARLVDEKNKTLTQRLEAFMQQFEKLAAEHHDVSIKCIDDRYFLNEQLVRFDPQGLSGAGTIVAEWKLLGIGGVRLQSSITIEEIARFVSFMASVKPKEENRESLSKQIAELAMPSVELLSVKEVGARSGQSTEEQKQNRQIARNSFFQAMATVQEIVVGVRDDQGINAAKTRRVVHSLIDHIMRDESSLLELTSIKNFDDYTYAHSTNVCIYSLTIGVRLGLDRARLSQLGFSALFHDIGKVKLPADLIRKPDAYDEDDWLQMQRHPLLGAKTILRNLKLDIYTARAARGAFEHHINSDFTGYPRLHYRQRRLDLFSKIISIADTFDALTSGRMYIRKSISPDLVIKKMCYQMKVKFDPFLLRLFSDVIGAFPAGTLVLLNSEELALILTNNETDRSRPMIKIVGNKSGLFEQPIWADLTQSEHAHRKIVRHVDPERYGLDLKQFVLSD